MYYRPSQILLQNHLIITVWMIGVVFLISTILSSCKKDKEEPTPLPSITSFAPTEGVAANSSGVGGTLVTITGSNFSSTTAENEIKFNNTIATAVSATENQLTAFVPNNATSGKIKVTINNATATSSSDFIVYQPPTITSFAPTSGIIGSTVTINGANFSSSNTANRVTFNGIESIVSNSTNTQLTVTVPSGSSTGKISVIVNGLTATSISDFVVIPSPTITSIIPQYGLPGETITITGTNFNSIPANNTVLFNGIAATVITSTSSSLSVSVPNSATSGNIAVSVAGAQAISNIPFEVLVDFPRNGLLFYYPFSSSLNEYLNSIFNFNDIPSYRQDRFNRSSQALNMDGTHGHSVPGTVLPVSPWTISFWAYYYNMTGTKGILSSTSNAVGVDIGLIPQGSGYIMEAWGRNGTGTTQYYLTGVPGTEYLPSNLTEWVNLTIIYEGTSFKIFKNGIQVFSNSSLDPFRVGKGTQFTFGSASGGFFTGGLDDLLIYNRALTQTEIQQLYQQTVSKYN